MVLNFRDFRDFHDFHDFRDFRDLRNVHDSRDFDCSAAISTALLLNRLDFEYPVCL